MQAALNPDTSNSWAMALCSIGVADTTAREAITRTSENFIFKD